MRFAPALLALPVLVLACSSPGSGASGAAPPPSARPESKDDVALSLAKSAALKLGTQVRTKLVDAMNHGGPANAVQVCAAEAQTIAAEVAKETGATVGRSSLALRNLKDAPPPWVQAWLVAQGGKKAAETQGLEAVVDVPGGRVARVLKPIAIDPVCLSCHGDPAQIAPAVKAVLAEKYPDDKATGYQAGDLRGALWAEVPVGG